MDETNPTLTRPPFARRLLRWVAWALAGVLVLLAVLAASVIATVRSDAGTAWLLARVPGLEVTGQRGNLVSGSFEAARLDYRADGLQVAVDGLAWRELRWRWRPREGALLGLSLAAPTARRVEVLTTPSPKPSAKPTAPGSLKLPLDVELQDLNVGVLQIDTQPPISGLQASLRLGADEGRLHRIDGLRFTTPQVQAQGQASVGSAAPLALRAELSLSAPAGATRPWFVHVQASGPIERLAVQAALRSGRSAAIDLDATLMPFADWPVAGLAARTQDLDLATLDPALPATRLSGRADITSTGIDAPVEAVLDLGNALPGRWDQARLPLHRLQASVRAGLRDRSTVTLERFALELGETSHPAGTLAGSGAWRNDGLAIDLTMAAMRPSQLDNRLAPMTLAGPLTLRLTGLPSPDGATPAAAEQSAELRGELQGRLDARGTPAVRTRVELDARNKPDGWQLDLRSLEASAGSARAQLAAQAEGTPAGAWKLKSQGELAAFDPARWFPGPAGSAWRQGPHRLNAKWKADLAGSAPAAAPAKPPTPIEQLLGLRGTATLDLRESRLAGVPLQGRAALRADGSAKLDGELRAAGNRLVFGGQAGARGAADRWRVELQAPALAALSPLLGLAPAAKAWLPRAGSASAEATLEGRWPQVRTQGRLQTQGLQAGELRVGSLAGRWQLGGNADAPLELQLDGEGIASGEQRLDGLRARLDGSLRSHRFEFDAQSPLRPPAWSESVLAGAASGTAARLRGEGAWQPAERVWQGRIAELVVRARANGKGANGANGGTPWVASRDLGLRLGLDADYGVREASAEPGRIELLDTALRWTDARWQAGAGTAAPRMNLDAQLDALPVVPWLTRLQPGFGWGGDLAIGGRFVVKTAERFEADLVLERSTGDLSLSDEIGTQAFGLTDLRFALSAQDGTWHITQAVAGANLGVLAGAQSLRVPPQAVWPPPETPLEGVLEWRVANLGVVTPWVPPGWRIGGSLRTAAALSGRFGAPEYTGEVSGSQLAVRNLLQGVDVRDGELAISLRGADAKIERARFKGGDGEIQIQGGASFGEQVRAQARVEARRFRVLGRFDRRVIASGSADVALGAQSLSIDGRFKVDEGLIDFSRGDAPALDDDVVVVRRTAQPEPDPSAAATAPPSAAARQTRLNVQVDLGEQLALRGRGIDTRLGGELAVTNPGGRLAVNGTIRTVGGTYAAYGQKLEISRGLIDFSGAVDNPRLDIEAVRPNLDVQVGVQVAGTATNPRVRLYSDPDMGDMDKLSWLLLGRAPEGLGRDDTALLQRAALAALQGENSGQGGLLKNIGLDDLSVRQTENGDTRDTVVALGKQISQRLYVGYERGVNATAGSWQLIYRVARRFTLRAQTGDDNALDAIWSWRWN